MPPPDVDIDAACTSIERIRERADLVLLSHFGPVAEVGHICELAERRLLDMERHRARRAGASTTISTGSTRRCSRSRALRSTGADSGEEIDMERYDVASSIRMNAMGLIRYWRKRAEREAAELAEVPIALEGNAQDS